MLLDVSEILYSFSIALDAVEGDILGATTYHSQRVAYLTSLMAKELGMEDWDRTCLAVASVLHDNALTQYIQDEALNGVELGDIAIEKALGKHCALGESNVTVLPISPHIQKAILLHHERADGQGPFGYKAEDTPIYARLIHLADRVDVNFNCTKIDKEKFNSICDQIKADTGTLYDKEVVDAFLSGVTLQKLKGIEGEKIVYALLEAIPHYIKDYTAEELLGLAKMFAKIIDYKSPFTTNHSIGIAEKAKDMGIYYGWDEETCDKLYLAGAVHDIGKLMVKSEILEKPAKLTEEEFEHIQNHAIGTYMVLKNIGGIDDIRSWAALHHEKLDGSGYPFGKTADELDKKERLMGCIDIYQALVEPRPYKDGFSHEKAMEIMYQMVEAGKIDPDITKDIDNRYKNQQP